MKILHLVPVFEIGGVQRQIANWVRFDKNHQHFLAVFDSTCTKGFGLLERQILTLRISNLPGAGPRDAQLRRFVAENAIDILLAHNRTSWDRAIPVIRRLPATALCFVAHGQDQQMEREDHESFVACLRQNATLTQNVVCSSDFLQQYFLRLLPQEHDKIRTIYNGVPLPPMTRMREEAKRELGIEAGTFVLGAVTRLEPVKNLGFLIQAISHWVRNGEKRILLVIVGEGTEKSRLRGLIAREGISAHILLKESTAIVDLFYRAFDVYVSSSSFESCSIALLEAMSYGLPVLVSAVGGNPEVVLNRETGFLFRPDDLADFVVKGDRLLKDACQRHRLGNRARDRISCHFSIETMLGNYQRMFLNETDGKSSACGRPTSPR